jgi:hypothetical protein
VEIPEGPDDLERLWHLAEPLPAGRLPAGLAPEDPARYRFVGSASLAGVPTGEQTRFFAELEELEAAGLRIHADARDDRLRHIFIASPRPHVVWSIGIYRGPSPFALRPAPRVQNPVLTRVDVTDVPAEFVADPFLIRVQESWYLFFEVMNWQTSRGSIGVATSGDGCTWAYRQVVLAEPFHLSYPYVFEWAGDYYLLPESHQAGCARLYRAKQFPLRWELVGTLLEGPYLADPSIFHFRDRWWLLVAADPGHRHDNLRLYHAADLLGPWVEHPTSPIVAGDPRTARPAGRVLVTEGRVYRFAQNCEPWYGTDVRAFEVTELTATRYREREVEGNPVVGPGPAGWNGGGMHHVDAHLLSDGDWLACVDGWFLHSPADTQPYSWTVRRPRHSDSGPRFPQLDP